MSDTPRTDSHQDKMEVEELDVELAKTYTFARQLERELGTTQKLLVDANRGAERNAKANWELAGHVNKARAELAKWQALAGQLAEALTFWDVNHPAFAAYEAAKESQSTKLATHD